MSEKTYTPLKAIREKCLDCCGQDRQEVRLCPVKGCSLYPFRMGKNPFNKRIMTEEQKAKAVVRLKKAREAKQTQGEE